MANSRGRPKKTKKEPISVVSVRMTKTEHDILTQMAEMDQRSLSNFLVCLIHSEAKRRHLLDK